MFWLTLTLCVAAIGLAVLWLRLAKKNAPATGPQDAPPAP